MLGVFILKKIYSLLHIKYLFVYLSDITIKKTKLKKENFKNMSAKEKANEIFDKMYQNQETTAIGGNHSQYGNAVITLRLT